MAKPDPRIAAPEVMAAVCALLAAHDFTAAALCGRLHLTTLDRFTPLRAGRRHATELESGLDLLIRLFLDEEYVSPADADRLLGPGALEPFLLTHLIYEENGHWASSGLLYPIGNLWLVSDRNANPDHSPYTPAPDAVYPAITEGGLRLLSLLPLGPTARMFEICGGAGPAALLAAAHGAAHTWSCDITPRSTHFARFNAALNGLQNVTALSGNLYDPVAGLQFDRIAAHPPYVPHQGEPDAIFRDGGSDGEQITEGVIAGAARHLAPGGLLYIQTYGTDRGDLRYEDRIRAWLGPAEEEFDVLLYEAVAGSPSEVLTQLTIDRRVDDWPAFVAAHGITGVFYGLIVLQRRAEPRRVFQVRRSGLAHLTRDGLGALLALLTTLVQPGFLPSLAAARPRPVAGLAIHSSHRIENGELVPTHLEVETHHPVPYTANVPPWLVRLLQMADGRRTSLELLAALEAEELISASPAHFLEALAATLQTGFLELAEADEEAPSAPPPAAE